MDLTVTRQQYEAVRNVKHLPDVLKKVLDKAKQNADGHVLHLTYEEATALNELAAWNVHSDAAGNVTPVWVVEVATGKSRQLTGGPGSDRQPRWSPDGKTLAFISTRDSGAQVWVLPIAGGDARKVSSLADGASDPIWLPDGSGLLVVSDIKWPPHQEIDQRNGSYPTEARIWTELMWRHWDDFRAGKRQHLFRVGVATGTATDLTPVDHDVPTIATSGDGDVTVSPDGKDILVAMHADTSVADNT